MAADAEQFYFRFRIWFNFGDVALFRSSVSINKPNFIVITPLGLIVLKITLLNSVSVFTNFVIPKRDKQKKKIEINMHHLRGNAIPAGYMQNPSSDSYEMLFL